MGEREIRATTKSQTKASIRQQQQKTPTNLFILFIISILFSLFKTITQCVREREREGGFRR